MIITKLKASNLKGHSFEHALAPVNLLYGANLSGKTSRLDAIRVGLLGYHPRLGKRNQDTFRLCSGASLNVFIDSVDEKGHVSVVGRQWAMQRGSVKYSGPDEQLVPPVLLDAREYLGLSAKEKTWYVFDRVDVLKMGYSDDALIAKIRNIKPESGASAISEQELNDIINEVRVTMQDRDAAKESVQQWMEKLVEYLTETKRDSDRAIKSMTGLMTAQTQLTNGAEAVEPPDVLAKRLEEAQREHSDALRKLQEVTRLEETLDKDLKRVRAARTLLKDEDPAKALEAERKRLRELEERVVALKKLPRALDLRDEIVALDLQGTEIHIKAISQQIERQQKDEEKALRGGACPFCGQSDEGWRKSYRKKMTAIVSEMEKELAALEKECAAKTKKFVLLSEKLVSAKAVDNEIEKAHEDISKLNRTIAALTEREREWHEAQRTVKEFKETQPPTEKELELLREQATSRRERVEEIQARYRRSIAARTDEMRREQARQQQRRLETSLEVKKMALAIVHDEMEALVARVMGTVLRRVDPVIEGLLPHRLEYRDGEIGWLNGSTFVGHTALFSGADETLVFAALSVALAQESSIKLVLMDELGRLDAPRKETLLTRMKTLVIDKTLDQVVLVDTSLGDYSSTALKGVNVIEVGR